MVLLAICYTFTPVPQTVTTAPEPLTFQYLYGNLAFLVFLGLKCWYSKAWRFLEVFKIKKEWMWPKIGSMGFKC